MSMEIFDQRESNTFSAKTVNVPGTPTKSSTWERICLTTLGASTTGPMYTVMYMSGWLKQVQGNSIVLELFITFYPVALGILLLQVYFDHVVEKSLGRPFSNLLRFGITSVMSAVLLPLIYAYRHHTASLWVIFAFLGLSHGVALGSAFELCLQMPRHVKGIEYLNVGMQVGGVATGIFGVMSGFTLQEHPNATRFYRYAFLTSCLCLAGFLGVLAMHIKSDTYSKVMRFKPEPPPSTIQETMELISMLRVCIGATVLTSGSTLLCNGFYTYAPTSRKDNPMDNSVLVVLLVYTNLCSDLIGRAMTTYLPCPRGKELLQMVSARLILVFVFFMYISQLQYLQDFFVLIVLHVLMVSHGVFTTWSFVHANALAAAKGLQRTFVSKFCVIILFVAILLGTLTGNIVERLFFLT
mmetsp:Transcript_20638/g.28844  ORF Transcript_20638/g.28844 Transcript_20638/m.28844 type:complete len:411 (+) Transcript_20638:700-1932(+)